MKIAFIAPRYHTNQKNLVNFLIKQKHIVSFYVTHIGEVEDYSDVVPILIKVSNFSTILKKIKKSNDEFYEYNSGLPSIKSIKEFINKKYDLVIIRNPNRMMAIVYSIVSKFFGIKIVFYSQMELHRQPSRNKDFMVKVFLNIFKADWITPCLGNSKYPKVDDRITYLPFSAEYNKYKKEWFQNSIINIIDIGKYEERKNHHILIKALQLLQNRYNFRLTIIGEASKPFRKKYFNSLSPLIKESAYEIRCINNIPLVEVFEYYKKSDLFILPASNEPASVSNLEAMSFGLPIITSDTNKTSCYTVHGENGYIFKSNNIEDLALKIELIIKDRNNLIKMGKKSYEILEKNHLADKIYGDFFKQLVITKKN
jgi:glycosyltransferase involved in cell wall biosynthesis